MNFLINEDKEYQTWKDNKKNKTKVKDKTTETVWSNGLDFIYDRINPEKNMSSINDWKKVVIDNWTWVAAQKTNTTFVWELQKKWLSPEETSLNARKNIALKMWIQWYEWTKEQNLKMQEFLKSKSADEIRSIIKWVQPEVKAEEVKAEEVKAEEIKTEDKKEWDEWFWTWDFLDESITGKKEATNDSTSESDETIVTDATDTSRGENVYEKALNETLDKYAESLNKTEEEKNAIRDSYAKKQKELIESTQEWSKERIEWQRKLLDEINNKYESNVSDSLQDIDENLQRTKNIASREANIAAALAWQWGMWMTASSVIWIQNNILWDWDKNISDATSTAITNRNALYENLKNNWINIFNSKKELDTALDNLDTAANAPLLNAIVAASEWDIKAKDNLMNFKKTLFEEQATSEFGRSESIERTSQDIEAYPKLSPDQKVAFMLDKIKNTEWSQFISDWVRNMILKYPDMSYPEIKAKLEKEAAYANQRNIISNTVFQKNYEDMSADEKKIISDVVDRWWAALARWDASVERTDKEVAEIDKQQAEFEEWKIDEAKKKLEEEKKKAEEDKKKEEAAKIEEEKKYEWFKWFKSRAAYNSYQEWLQKLSLAKEKLATNKDPALAEKIKATTEALKKYKEKYSI